MFWPLSLLVQMFSWPVRWPNRGVLVTHDRVSDRKISHRLTLDSR